MFYMIGDMSFKCLIFFDSIASRHISKPNQKSMMEHFCKKLLTTFSHYIFLQKAPS